MMDRLPETQSIEVDIACAADLPPAPTFESLFQVEFSYVYNTLRRLGVRTPDIEDLTNEVFVAVYQGLPRFDTRRPVRPWLFGIAFHVASAYRRKPAHTRELLEQAGGEPTDPVPLADDQIASEEARRLVLAALSSLDFERRAVIVMHDIDGIPVPQIAEALSIPLNTAYSRVRLGREQLKAAVKRLRQSRGEQ